MRRGICWRRDRRKELEWEWSSWNSKIFFKIEENWIQGGISSNNIDTMLLEFSPVVPFFPGPESYVTNGLPDLECRNALDTKAKKNLASIIPSWMRGRPTKPTIGRIDAL